TPCLPHDVRAIRPRRDRHMLPLSDALLVARNAGAVYLTLASPNRRRLAASQKRQPAALDRAAVNDPALLSQFTALLLPRMSIVRRRNHMHVANVAERRVLQIIAKQ